MHLNISEVNLWRVFGFWMISLLNGYIDVKIYKVRSLNAWREPLEETHIGNLFASWSFIKSDSRKKADTNDIFIVLKSVALKLKLEVWIHRQNLGRVFTKWLNR